MSLEIDCDVLITEVQKRTPLYDTSNRESYNDRALKKRLWFEVSQEVYSPAVWNPLSSQEKCEYALEVQKRWASLRHCFRRELRQAETGKNTLTASGAKRKRKYLYFDSLLFLLPFTENGNTEESAENEDNEGNNLENGRDTTPPAETKPPKPKTVQKKIVEKNSSNIDEKIITLLKQGNDMLCNSKMCDCSKDEDELFFRSLIPHVKKFTGDQKLLLRMEIMKTILTFKETLYNSATE